MKGKYFLASGFRLLPFISWLEHAAREFTVYGPVTLENRPPNDQTPRFLSPTKGHWAWRQDRSCSVWYPIRTCFLVTCSCLDATDSTCFVAHLSVQERLLMTSCWIHCRTLSALAHWSAIFGEVDYLALLSFPFVKLFQNNQLICFEMIATILSKSSA